MIDLKRVLSIPTVFSTLLLLIISAWSAPAFSQEPVIGPLAGTTAAHNAIRQALNNGTPPVPGAAVQPVACPAIPDFVWSDTVAASAQTWANGCSLNHEGPTNPYGENLSLAGAGFGLTGPTSAVSWADEVKDGPYDYNAHTCGPNGTPAFPACGHYTAVTWANTTEVGCGFATCGGTEWLVCRYNQGGNVNIDTTRPYCTAQQTTNCQMPPQGMCNGGGTQALTVQTNGTGTGTVISNPAGINCGATCMANFTDGIQVQLTATATGNSNFVTWSGDCAGAGNNAVCNVQMSAARDATATFNTGGGGNACTGATDLLCGVPLNGTTVGATADLNGYNCTQNNQGGNDVVYRLVPPAAGNVTVDLTPNAEDLDLFVLNACNTANCDGASENGGATPEQVIFAANAAQPYYVIVEDFNSAGDTYTLTATCPGGGCNAPDGQDQNLANTTENVDRTVHVCGTITTGAAYVIGGAAHVTLIAPTSVSFGNGFSVLTNGRLTVKHN